MIILSSDIQKLFNNERLLELKAEKTKQIDKTDSKILNTLLIESRTSFTELAKICGISITATIRRYNRLKKTA